MPNVLAGRLELQDEIGIKLLTLDEFKDEKYLKNDGNDDSFYRIIDKDSIEVVESYTDRFPCLNCRKSIMKLKVYIKRGAIMIVTNSVFETISIIVIVANSLFLALDDPLAETPPVYQYYSDTIFQVLYTIEMILKICAMGFFINKGSYLRDSWNILDFIIVISGYVSMFMSDSGGGANLSVLRSFRVIRPLRTISSIEGLRVIVSALVASLPLLRDTILVLLFFFIIFAIAGVQLFQGTLKNRCVNIETGVQHTKDLMCATIENCPEGYFCGKRIANPNSNATSFDNVLYALMLIFQTVTLEGWTNIMIALEQCVATWVVVYFIPIVFIGAFFLLNLTLAVIKSKFTEEHKSKKGVVKKKKVSMKKRGIDDSSEEEIPENGENLDGQQYERQKNKMEFEAAQLIKELEQNQDLSPEKKKELKERLRISYLVNKVETIIHQREAHNKITPLKTIEEQYNTNNNNQKQFTLSTSNKSLYSKHFKNYDFAKLFQNQYSSQVLPLTPFLDNNIKQDPEETQNISRFFQDNQGQEEPQAKDNNKIKSMMGIINKIERKTVSSGLLLSENGIQPQKTLNQNNIIMSGIAGIKRKQFSEEDTLKENKRKEVYDRIQQQLDMFDFLDSSSSSSNEFGDDELSQWDPQERNENNNENAQQEQLEKKISDATTEAKSFSKKEQHQKENTVLEFKLTLLKDKSSNQNDKLQNPRQSFLRKQKTIKIPKKSANIKQSKTDNQKSPLLKNKVKEPQTASKIRFKALQIFTKKKKSETDTESLKQGNSAQLLKAKQSFKISIQKDLKNNQSKKLSPRTKALNSDRSNKQNQTDFDVSTQSVKQKSEKVRKNLQIKEHQEFKERERKMAKRRNFFFAQSVRHIGKTKEQLRKEKRERLLKKRLIQIGGGYFEQPPPDSPNYNRRKLMKSATLMQRSEKLEREEITPRPNNNNNDISTLLRKNSFKEDSAINNLIRKLKEELDELDEEERKIPDLENELFKKKKKIALKMKNYKFGSILDVVENRDEETKIKLIQHGKSSSLKIKKKKLTKEEKKKLAEQIKDSKRKPVQAYQKKIKMHQKKYQIELVQEDARESDENQDDVIARLENRYNTNHRSDIHVTGTLSIVFDKHKAHTKIMNPNYYAHERQGGYQNKININNEQNISEFEDRSSRRHDTSNLSMGSLGNQRSSELPKLKASRNSSTSFRQQNSSRHESPKPTGKKSSQNVGKSIFSNTKSNQRNTSGVRSSNATTAMQIAQKPEIMTDKQILKRLNLEVKKSTIFKHINFKKLPEEIRRKIANQQKKKQAKKPQKKKNQLGEDYDGSEEKSSDLSDENQQQFMDDYFIDRELNMGEVVQKAKSEAFKKPIDHIEWSGQEIMPKFDPYKARIAVNRLNEIRIWPKGKYGCFKKYRTLLKRIMKSGFIENLMTLCVFANTIILSMDYYGIDQETSDTLSSFNTFFTIIFSIEMFLKIIAIGLGKWLNDKMNYMDGAIVLMSLVEMAFLSGNGALSAFRSVRMFRTLRVLRVARLLRGLKSMMNIIAVIQKSISSFIYLGMLLFLFIFIYALLGMQLFGGQFSGTSGSNRYNFDTFNQAFVTSFILLSMENWNQVLYNAMASDVNKGITSLYFISCIFVGNFMLLNLFLAILLDAFTSVEEEDHDTPEKKEKRDKERIEGLKKKEGEDLVLGMDDVDGGAIESTKGEGKKKKKKKSRRAKKSQADSNILDESMEIDLETLAKKKEETSKQKKKLFEGIECEKSLYMFSKQNPMRIVFYKIITNTKFEWFILVLIILSSIKLINDTYLFGVPDDDPKSVGSGYMDIVFTILFTWECIMKVIAFGFVQDKNSYLRETWSQMDFFIVTTSLIDASAQNINIPMIRILRLLRILRPLRFISHNSSMKVVVVSLLSSMGGIFNVGIVVVAVFLMFSILGVNLFAGKLQYCTVDKYIVQNKLECFQVRGEWTTNNQNFDNVLNGMITLFGVATLEGWPDLMYAYTDIMGLELGPRPGASPINAYFFVGFVFIGAFFFMNLFVGVLFMNFEAAQKDEAAALLLDREEIRWVDMMKMIISTKPEIIKIPKNRVSRFIYKYTKAETKFDFFIMICIILNMVQMAINYEGQPAAFTKGLEASNYMFTAIFAIECFLKLIANGWAYFLPAWNKFDFFVVSASFIDIVMGQLSATSLKFLRVGPQLARVLRVLRVSRLFRLLNKYKGLQALLQTITFSLPSLMNVFALLMLVYFIFSVLAVFMFNEITDGKIIDPVYMNFLNFGQAMILLIRLSTGEDWPTVMYDTMNTSANCIQGVNCGVSYAPVFFIPFIMVCSYVMLNLFIMIIIQQFEMYYLPEDNTLQRFRDNLDDFKRVWHQYSKEYEGLKIRMFDLVPFFKALQKELAIHAANDNIILRECVKMNLESDEDNFIYFNELLFKSMKRIFGQEKTKKKILADLELKALDQLQQILAKQMAKSRKSERFRAVTVNPFLAVMYKSMSFKAWKKQFFDNLQRRQDEIQFQLDRESEDEEYEIQNKIDQDWEYVTENDMSVNEDEFEEQISQSQNDINYISNYQLIDQKEIFATPIPKTQGGAKSSSMSLNSQLNSNKNVEEFDIKQNSESRNNQYDNSQYQQKFQIKLQQTQFVDGGEQSQNSSRALIDGMETNRQMVDEFEGQDEIVRKLQSQFDSQYDNNYEDEKYRSNQPLKKD